MDENEIKNSLLEKLHDITTLSDLQDLETSYLGRKGKINELMNRLSSLSSEEKRSVGPKLNATKKEVEELFLDKKKELLAKHSKVDLPKDTSLPGIHPKIGNLHPTTETIRSINNFFHYMGFSVYDGPEIENNEYNFEKLNLPPDHPARDLQDTLYISEPEWLLRTHTSSVEIRAMTQEKLPLRIVVPGKVYRNETSNVTNNSMFYQYEGLVVDKNITLAHLKGTLTAFAKFLYGEQIKTRFRAKYYPQVEPGAGMDISCTFCDTVGCAVCKYRGYIEVLGAGMVHPNVLKACDIDSKKFSGFAFGMGLDRLVMLRYAVSDIRKLYNGELVVI